MSLQFEGVIKRVTQRLIPSRSKRYNFKLKRRTDKRFKKFFTKSVDKQIGSVLHYKGRCFENGAQQKETQQYYLLLEN